MRIWILLFLLTIISCIKLDQNADYVYDKDDVELAVPLFVSHLTIPSLVDASDGLVTMTIGADGLVTIIYSGKVIEQSSFQIFPPIPGILDVPLIDSISFIPIPLTNSDVIDEAVIGETNIDFNFSTLLNDIITITVTIPQLIKNGNIFSAEFTIDNSNGGNGSITTPQVSIEGFTLFPENNGLSINYNARRSSGDRILLDNASMGFDLFRFKYVEGKFGFRTFDVQGDIINIDIFNYWKAGNVSFSDPKVILNVVNAFGLLTKSKVNSMNILTVDNESLTLESPILDQGIDFDFPSLDEVGESKTTSVEFNKGNSNIRELFEQRANKVSYDIDALINSENPEFLGFLTDSSFFRINVTVNLPLDGNINDLVLTDNTDLDLTTYENIKEVEFKLNISNAYPVKMMVQAYFLDESDNPIDSLFAGEGISIEEAEINEDGDVISTAELDLLIPIDSSRVTSILAANKVSVIGRFSSPENRDNVLILESHYLDIKAGAKIKLK